MDAAKDLFHSLATSTALVLSLHVQENYTQHTGRFDASISVGICYTVDCYDIQH